MRHHLVGLILASSVAILSVPASATADLSPRLPSAMSAPQVTGPSLDKRASAQVGHHRASHADKTGSSRGPWLAMLMGFGLLGALGRRPAAPFDEQL